MTLTRNMIATAAAMISLTAGAGAQADSSAIGTAMPAIDSIFADLAAPSPGCAVGVLQDGAVVYARGYGLASVELGVPITARTVFDIGSVSKQFTAAALVLLAQEGKLSLDDDVRRWVPELKVLKTGPITIRQMLHHTSGIRDYTDLLIYDGAQIEQVTGAHEALAALSRQRAGNFVPGSEWQYSNSGFFLAGVIAERASGKPLRELLRERVFGPLGMTHSLVLDDHTLVVPGKASSYSPKRGGGVRVEASNWEQVGDGSVQTTIGDLAKWDENFYTGTVGGRSMLEALTTPGRLTNGATVGYALGLDVDRWRGLARVSHGGAWAGFRAQLTRFPERHTSVVTLCNLSSSRPWERTDKVSEAVLESALAADPVPKAVAIDEGKLAGAEGKYFNWRNGDVATLSLKGDSVRLARDGVSHVLTPLGGQIWFDAHDADSVLFGSADGRRTITAGTGLYRATLTAMAPYRSSVPLASFTGRYETNELLLPWTVTMRGSALVVHVGGDDSELTPAFEDAFESDFGLIRFQRDSKGAVTSLTVTTRGVRGLALRRTGPAPSSAAEKSR